MGYDAVRYVEDLPDRPVDDRDLPEMVWQFVGSLAALDRFDQTITLVRNVFTGGDPTADYRGSRAGPRSRCRPAQRRTSLRGSTGTDRLSKWSFAQFDHGA